MSKILAIFALFALNFAFGFTPAKTDWQELNLKGAVRKMTQITREFENSVQVAEKRIVRYFDKRGFLQTQKYYFNDKLSWLQSYEYDTQGYLIKSNTQNTLYLHSYEKHADGSLTERKVSQQDDENLRSVFTTYYDKKGKILSQKQLHGAKNELISDKSFHYDQKGLLYEITDAKNAYLTQHIEYKFKGKKMAKKCQISEMLKQCSEYDSRENVIKSMYEYNGFRENLVYENKLDRRGNLTLIRSFFEENGVKTDRINSIVQIKYEYYK